MLFKKHASNARAIAEIQSDYEQTFSTPAGRRVFADLALMWGAFGGDMQGMVPEYREAFMWILDRMGKNHIENLQEIADAVLQIRRVIPEPDELEPEDETYRRFEQTPVRSEGEYRSWRTPR